MPVLLRAFLLTVPRFIVILAMVIGLNRLDVSPLPEWTVAVSAYTLHFLVTFLFALWAMHGRFPRWGQVFAVVAMFLVFGVMWEVGLYTWMTHASFREVIAGFNRGSFSLLCVYALATFLAGAYVRQSRVSHAADDSLRAGSGSNDI